MTELEIFLKPKLLDFLRNSKTKGGKRLFELISNNKFKVIPEGDYDVEDFKDNWLKSLASYGLGVQGIE